MYTKLVPPSFGRAVAADDALTINSWSSERARKLRRAGCLGLMIGCLALALPQASFGAAAQLSGLSCSTSSIAAEGPDSCTVTMNQDVVNNRRITLRSSSSAVSMPGSVTVPAGSSSAGFSVWVSGVSGTQTVTLTASAGGSSETYQLHLSGPTIGLSTTNVAFGNQPLKTIATKTVTVSPTGTMPLTIYAVTVGGSGFSWEGINTPLTLAPGQTATLVIIFDPTTAGAASGVATVIYDGGVTATIALTGTGGTTTATPAGGLGSVSCGSASLTGAGTDACTVTLTGAAASAMEVNLASSNGAVTVPASVTVPVGASSAGFSATASAVSTTQTATLTATAGGASTTYPLVLNAVAPGLSLSATSVAFGTDLLNTPMSKTVMVTSSGTAQLILSGATAAGQGFSVSGVSAPITLNPGQTAMLTVGFDPTSTGAVSGMVTISSNASSSSAVSSGTIALSGTGQAAATLSGVTCGSATLAGAGTDGCTVSFTSAVTSATVVSLASSSSALTVPASVTVAAGASSAGFTATATAVSTTQTATLTATAAGASATYPVQLNGVNAGLSLSATSVAFGTDSLNTAMSKTVTVTSTGTADLILSGATASGAGFSVSGISAPITLNPGQTAVLTVGFDPALSGAVSGTVLISSNAPSTPTITLTGTGQAPPTVSGVSCTGGSLTGAVTDACTVTLTGPVTVGTLVSLASSSGAVTVPASVTVAAGASSAAFTATASAVTTGQTVTLTASAGGVAATYPLQLNAAIPGLKLSTTSVAFGNVNLNTATTQVVTLSSSGTAPVTINSASISGTGFTMSGPTATTLNPGQTASLTVAFDPTTAVTDTGTVTITSNSSSGGTQTIGLSGTGTSTATYQVALTWEGPASSSVPVMGYNVYRAASGSSTYTLLNSSMDASTTYTDTTVQSGLTYNYEVTSVGSGGVQSAPSPVYTAAIP